MTVIEGTVEEIKFSSNTNGFTVCEIRCNKDLITAVGYMPFINYGEILKLTGKWVKHPDYGEQLKVEMYEKILPRSTDAIEKYLASGIIKGVGAATAGKIVEKFGEDTLDIIQFYPEKLTGIKGISTEKALRIGQAFEEQRELRNVVMFFQEYGISPEFSAKIHRILGTNTIQEIRSNPYRLVDDAIGISFKIADRIAGNVGIDPSSRYRICSGIKYILSRAASDGHTYVPDDRLKEFVSGLLDIDIGNIDDALVSLMFDRTVRVEKEEGQAGKVYLSTFHSAETGICRKLAEMSSVVFKGDTEDIDEKIDMIQSEEGLELADNQKLAVREALKNSVMIITGGPGTGKTTIIKSIIKILNSEGYEVILAAPTGRAARRMTEATGFEAKTIHRLLEIGYMGADSEPVFSKTEANPIETDAIIIDEMSMVDVLLMNNLLKAVVPGTRLILVGDVNQLPSVGAGNVLKDIIASGFVKTVKLTEIFRQAGESMIIVNAHRINRGEYPFLNKKDRDFFFIQESNGEDIVRTIVELCSKRLPATYGYDPVKHIQVLTPTRKGTVGVQNLNIKLQEVLNPSDIKKNEKPFGSFTFREGDRVMQTRNNYELIWMRDGNSRIEGTGVFNGDTGNILGIDLQEHKITVIFEDEKYAEYDFDILDEIEPAFAVTVHKSQGSEFPVVIMPVYPGPHVLITRNLLYTAVTRAKELVILVGQESILCEMIKNEKETRRFSGLAEKLAVFRRNADGPVAQ